MLLCHHAIPTLMCYLCCYDAVFLCCDAAAIHHSAAATQVIALVRLLSKLADESRPFGLMIEDQNGSWMPMIMEDAVHAMRQVKDQCASVCIPTLWNRSLSVT